MSPREYSELLDFFRTQLRGSEYASLDDSISHETANIENPKDRLIEYLNMLINMIRERSNQRARTINERLENVLQVEGGNFSGVEVELTDVESRNFEISRFSLYELDDVSELISGLESVRDDLLDESDS